MKHPQHIAMFAVLALALALRLILWAQPLHQPANDEVEYIRVARDLLAGRGWEFYTQYHWLRAPLYPLFLAGSLWLAGGDFHLAALPNLFLSVGVVYLIYLLVHELSATRVRRQLASGPGTYGGAPLLAALLAALLMTYNTFASLYMSETLFTFLFTAALLLLLRWKNRQPAIGYLLLAGVCFGLAVLTRSLPLTFLPVILIWIGLIVRHRRPHAPEDQARSSFIVHRLSLVAIFVFTVCVFLPIAPWTFRNCQAYGRCILVETGLSYNLWAFNEPREDQQTIFRTLERIPNPAERADEATRRGLARLREDPAILLRKIRPNWIALWAVKPIQDRFLMANYYADPSPLVFLAGLIFDDVLYYLILVAAVIGLMHALAKRSMAALLLALWLAYVVAISLITHGEGRYRHFVFMVLIPPAAMTIVDFRLWISNLNAPKIQLPKLNMFVVPAAILLLGLLLYPLRYYPWEWAIGGAARSVHRIAGDIAVARGDLAGAEAAYQRALNANATPDGWLALGDLYRQQGDLARAEEMYRFGWSAARPYVGASARLGDLYREQGRLEEARTAFIGIYAAEQNVLDWSWANLNPLPVQRINLGNGLDFGYVGGVYPTEEQQGALARWTNGRAWLRLAAGSGEAGAAPTSSTPGAQFLLLRLAAPHPNASSVTAQVCVADSCQPIEIGPTWRRFQVQLPASAALVQVIELRSPTFNAPDGRQLGMLVDWAAVSRGN